MVTKLVNYRRKTNKLKKQKAGKYIAQGTYGCVFGDPPLKCKNEAKRNSDDVVSKLMDHEAAKEEMDEGARWNKIDPTQQFSLTSSKKCNVDSKDIKPENSYEKCTVRYDYSLLNRVLVFYKNGGEDLKILKPISDNYEKIFSGFQNLFDGLVIAHKNNLIHTDIKPPNILTGKENIHLRFIDFGLSFVIDKPYVNSIYTDNDTYYPYWPFELGCFSPYGKLRNEKFIEDRYKLFNTTFNAAQIGYGLTQFKIPFETIYNTYIKTDFSNLKSTFEKVDVYSMGITLIDLLRDYFHHEAFQQADGKNYLFYNNKSTDSLSRFETLKDKNWLSNKQLDYQHYLLTNVTQPLIEFINHCVDYNPNTRYTAQQAADEYRKLLPNFKKHLKQNEIRKGLAGLDILNETNDLPLIPTPRKEPTPKPKEPTPKPKEPTPKPKEPTPKPKEPTPKEVFTNNEKSNTDTDTDELNNKFVKLNIKNVPVEAEVVEKKTRPTRKLKPKVVEVPAVPEKKSKTTRKIKNNNMSIIPSSGDDLKRIYYASEKKPDEDSELIRIARALHSRVNYTNKTKLAIVNDIIHRAGKRDIDLQFIFKK